MFGGASEEKPKRSVLSLENGKAGEPEEGGGREREREKEEREGGGVGRGFVVAS